MTVSAMSPSSMIPAGYIPTASVMPNAQQQLGTYGSLPMLGGVGAASSGAQIAGYPSDLTSLLAAASLNPTGTSALGMQAQPAVAAVQTPKAVAKAKKKVKPKAKKVKTKAKSVTKSKVKPKAKPKPKVDTQATPTSANLPANATQLPNGTVYSFADASNPALAGLSGLTPQQQLALGIMPSSMSQGMPQANITNQSNIDSRNPSGMLGLGLTAGVPTLGAPIASNTNLSQAATAQGSSPTTSTTTGGEQKVTNRNNSDNGSTIANPYSGFGFGGMPNMGMPMPYDYTGGLATPFAPYGASMTGAGIIAPAPSGGVTGWLSRLVS